MDPPSPAGEAGGGPRRWRRLATEEGPDLLVARARFDTVENPRTAGRLRRVVLAAPDWVNVVALTPAEELVVVRQFRFGADAVTTEIPGGVVDPGEEPAQAARRELREETGYTGARWSLLGVVDPNPAFLDNRCHLWLVEGATRTHEPALDPGEDIEVGVLSLDRARAAVENGEIRHSLVICALSRVLDLRARR